MSRCKELWEGNCLCANLGVCKFDFSSGLECMKLIFIDNEVLNGAY